MSMRAAWPTEAGGTVTFARARRGGGGIDKKEWGFHADRLVRGFRALRRRCVRRQFVHERRRGRRGVDQRGWWERRQWRRGERNLRRRGYGYVYGVLRFDRHLPGRNR